MEQGESQMDFFLLSNLLSVDNAVRSKAEETYKNLQIEIKLTYLFTALKTQSLSEEVRQLAAVLLRKILATEFLDIYPKLTVEQQNDFKENVLLLLEFEENEKLRRKICELAAEIARNLMDDEGNSQWPEYLRFIFQCLNTSNESLKEVAMRLFASNPCVFGNKQNDNLDTIKQMLAQCVLSRDSYKLRFYGVKALLAFLTIHDKEPVVQNSMLELFGPAVQVLAESIEAQDDDQLLKSMIDLAENSPKFFRPQVAALFDLCLKVFSNENILYGWRHLSLELLISLCENAPAMVRKMCSKYIPHLVAVILATMTQLDEDEDWTVSDEVVEEDNESYSVFAETALDRLSCGLGGKTLMPLIEQHIPTMLTNSDWKYRHAALMALSAVGEGCHKQMEPLLPQIMEGVLNFLQDSHPRVRYAACNALGQMSTDFAPTFEKKFHDKVVPGLLMLLEDNDHPRVQAHAGAALVNFSEDCPKNILTQYLDAIMAKLEAILTAKFKELVERGTKLVLEQVVTTIASVADTSEEQFIAYYDRLVPCLKYIIQNAVNDDHKLLRGKAIECVSLIGLAVGAEKFMRDASEIMDMLLKTQMAGGQVSDDDPQFSYLISAWARMCRILGKQFTQYLPLVMGPVMHAASIKPEVALFDEEDMADLEGDIDWQFVSLGEQQNFGIKTSGLEEKASACEMLVCYARELKEGFAEYTEDVVKLMVPLLKFYFHDGVRTAASESLPYLLESAKVKGPQFVQGMWSYIYPELLKAVDTEPEQEVLSDHMHSLAKCIETLGNGCLTEEAMIELVRILDKYMVEHFKRAVERLEKRKDEDYDDVVEEQLEFEGTEDVYIFSKVADIMHSLFIAYKTSFYPYFDQIVGHFIKCLDPCMSWPEQQWALCVWDDVIEFGGPSCTKYKDMFLQPLLRFTTDKHAEVRQAAVYGWGVLGQYGGEEFADACSEAIPALMQVINEPNSRSVDNINATENAISAVTKILKYNSSRINIQDILPHWLAWLPVWEDSDEAIHVYTYLCDLIEANHPVILGPNNTNLPRLIAIMAEVFVRKAIDHEEEISKRMIGLIRQTQASGDMFQVCLSLLSSEQLQVVLNIINS